MLLMSLTNVSNGTTQHALQFTAFKQTLLLSGAGIQQRWGIVDGKRQLHCETEDDPSLWRRTKSSKLWLD